MRDDGEKPAHDSMGCHIYNHGRSASARCYWHKMCLQMVASGVIDGCGADASQAMGGDDDGSRWQISAQELAAWRSGHQQMLAELPGLLGNGVLLGDVDCPGCDWGALPATATGVHSEHCAPTNETINGLRRAGREHPGKIIQCHFTEDRSGTGQDVHHSIAAFLIGMCENHYWGVGYWVGRSALINCCPRGLTGAVPLLAGQQAGVRRPARLFGPLGAGRVRQAARPAKRRRCLQHSDGSVVPRLRHEQRPTKGVCLV